MFMKKPRHRVFDYTPQYYDPETDEELKEKERRKRRLGFRSAKTRHKIKTRNPLYYILLFALLLYLYLVLSGTISF